MGEIVKAMRAPTGEGGRGKGGTVGKSGSAGSQRKFGAPAHLRVPLSVNKPPSPKSVPMDFFCSMTPPPPPDPQRTPPHRRGAPLQPADSASIVSHLPPCTPCPLRHPTKPPRGPISTTPWRAIAGPSGAGSGATRTGSPSGTATAPTAP